MKAQYLKEIRQGAKRPYWCDLKTQIRTAANYRGRFNRRLRGGEDDITFMIGLRFITRRNMQGTFCGSPHQKETAGGVLCRCGPGSMRYDTLYAVMHKGHWFFGADARKYDVQAQAQSIT